MISLFQGATWQLPSQSVHIYRVADTSAAPPFLGPAMTFLGVQPPSKEEWQSTPAALLLEREPHMFMYYKASGAVRYVDNHRWQIDDGSSTLSVPDSEAIDAATRIAQSMALFEDDQFQPLRVTRLNVASASKRANQVTSRVIDVGIIFQRMIEGLPVEGPGGKVVIYLDHELRLTGFERIARRIAGTHEPVKSWRTPEEVEKEVRQYWGLSLGRDMVLEDVRFGYAELGRLQKQEFLQPAYVLMLRFESGEEGRPRRCAYYVAAAVNSIGTLMPAPIEGGFERRREDHE